MRLALLLSSIICIAGCPLKKEDRAKAQSVDPCEYLVESQKNFSALLSKTHQQVFCGQFTNEQREKAMQLSGTGITPDEAVEQTLTQSRGTPATPATPKKKKHKGLTIVK